VAFLATFCKLIDAYEKNEKIVGYTTIFNLIEFPKVLELDLTVLYPSKSDYNLALRISTELLKIGKPIPAIEYYNFRNRNKQRLKSYYKVVKVNKFEVVVD